MLIRALHSVLRAPEGEEGAAGGAQKPATDSTEAAALRAELADYKRKESEAKTKADKAEKDAARGAGEIDKLVQRYESQIAERDTRLADLTGQLDSHVKQGRSQKLTEAVAAKLGIPVSPTLIGLLPQTGEDTAPEKITDAIVGKVAEAVRKLAPDLKPSSTATSAASGGGRERFASDEDYWRDRGKKASGTP